MARPTEQRTLHFALPFLATGCEASLHVGRARHPLQKHTANSLAASRRTNRALRLLPDHMVTHYVPEITLPSDVAQLLFVTTPSAVAGAKLPTILLTKIHTPQAAYREAVRRQYDRGFRKPHPALLMAGVHDDGTDPELPPDVDDWTSAMDAAVQAIFQHSELLNIDGTSAATVKNIITICNGISDLANQILQQATAHQQDPTATNWVFETPYSNPDGTPSNTMRYVWSPTTQLWMRGPMQDSLRKAKNDPHLQSSDTVAGNYTVQSGITAVGGASSTARLRGMCVKTSAAADSSWTVNNYTPQNGFTYNDDISLSGGIFSASFTNSWLRWLSSYVEFLGPDGQQPVVPQGWTSQVPGGLAATYDSDTKKYVALISSVSTILGIPLSGSPTTISFPWPSNASGVRFLSGGIGRSGGIEGQDGKYYGGWDQQVCAAGAMMTGIFCLGLPTVCLAMGAFIPQTELEDLAKSLIGVALDIGSAIVNGTISGTLGGGDMSSIILVFADAIPHLLLDSPDLVLAINAAVAEEAVEESTPIFGWIALGVSILTTVAGLVETSVEVGLSPAVFTLEATRAIDAQWTLLPDPKHTEWPPEATHYVVTATFTDGTTRLATGAMDADPQSAPITVQFDASNKNQLPAGGTVTFQASFYSDTDWLCGTAVSAPISAAVDADTLVVPQQAITEILIPLQASTRYLYGKSLAFDPATSRHIWADARPQATIGSLNPGIDNTIGALGQITVNQPQNQLGYSWQASGQGIPLEGGNVPSNAQMYAFQTVSTLADPEAGLRFVPSGFTASAPVAYDLTGTSDGNHFYVDSTNALFHLRKLVLDGSSGSFRLPIGTSWGRFNQPIDACIIHPSGAAIGLNRGTAKLEVLSLVAGVVDEDAPLAEIYCGYGSRAGLLHQPVGLAPAVGSGVIVLENADTSLPVPAAARMQAFDLKGNPAPIFAGNTTEALIRTETAAVTCLSIATESKGFIYVLKYTGDGSRPEQYLLDLYAPDGSFLAQTAGLPAGGITVDLWRTLYTLDFSQIAKPGGGRTEPSVSFWTPTTP
jgi:hypothetical protein